MRYYAEEDGSITFRILNTSFTYGNEYLGTASRLVISPLTMVSSRMMGNDSDSDVSEH